ncbi:ATP-binding protein [Pseudodesulfovibrio sp. zrk46]|uniref:nucleotide-binding protein n=1 Tax=Pseudodesulfovibrio sp. zrk46 TaxID=2725288 RepID=UPI001449C528|nr:ATP-binding protein [Pseudodesulfovibrio sp. zrk46]QJB58195.1 4Fe-4S binding protein [Pseudodesulfovibrio sp. zrk46]
MIYAIASGKGGTGKTTVTASLASIWETPLTAVDLDVEEPNLHLFLKPEEMITGKAHIEVPDADEDKCTGCRACSELCQFKAITVMGDTLLTFPEMCHGCGGCIAICPEKALTPGKRELGEIVTGKSHGNEFIMGRLRIGEAMSPPLMKQILNDLPINSQGDVLIDAPPGVSCPAITAVMRADCIVLVTEPTPFGLHDFRLAWEAFSPIGKPMGAVINRAGVGNNDVYDFCREKDIPIWAEIPFDRSVAEAYSNGYVPVKAIPTLKPTFESLKNSMQKAVNEVSHA